MAARASERKGGRRKHLEVARFLEQLLQTDPPPFPADEASVDRLHAFATATQQRSAATDVLAEDAAQRAREYDAECAVLPAARALQCPSLDQVITN